MLCLLDESSFPVLQIHSYVLYHENLEWGIHGLSMLMNSFDLWCEDVHVTIMVDSYDLSLKFLCERPFDLMKQQSTYWHLFVIVLHAHWDVTVL